MSVVDYFKASLAVLGVVGASVVAFGVVAIGALCFAAFTISIWIIRYAWQVAALVVAIAVLSYVEGL